MRRLAGKIVSNADIAQQMLRHTRPVYIDRHMPPSPPLSECEQRSHRPFLHRYNGTTSVPLGFVNWFWQARFETAGTVPIAVPHRGECVLSHSPKVERYLPYSQSSAISSTSRDSLQTIQPARRFQLAQVVPQPTPINANCLRAPLMSPDLSSTTPR